MSNNLVCKGYFIKKDITSFFCQPCHYWPQLTQFSLVSLLTVFFKSLLYQSVII